MNGQGMSESAHNKLISLQFGVVLILAALPVLLLSLYLYRTSVEAEGRLIDLDTRILSQALRHRIEAFVRGRVSQVKLTAAFYEGSDEITVDEFASYAGSLMTDTPEFSCLAYFDVKGKLVRIYPQEPLEIAQKNMESSGLAADVRTAINEGRAQVISSTLLPGNLNGVAILSPVFLKGKVVGMVLGGIALPGTIGDIFGQDIDRYWHYVIVDERGNSLFDSLRDDAKYGVNPLIGDSHSVEEAFQFGERQWRLKLQPRHELAVSLHTFAPEKILLGGAFTTVLVILGVASLLWRQRRLQQALEEISRSHEVLQESERRFRDVMERVQLLGVVTDREGKIVFCNDRFLRTTGCWREEVIGKDLIEVFVVAEQRESIRERYKEVVEGRTCLVSGQVDLLSRADGVRQVMWNHVISYGADGEVDVVTSLGDDITERLAHEEITRQSQKLESLGVLAGGIAHDFNNLLTAIIGHNDLALRTADSSTRVHLEKVAQTARRLADLTGQMLAYSGRRQVELKPVDLNTVVREMTDLIRVSIPKRIGIVYDLAEDLPMVEGDPTQLEQVLLNLVTNAAESIQKQSGRITVCTQRRSLDNGEISLLFNGMDLQAGQFAELTVQDNGSGIPAEKLSRIFDPFFTTKFTGRGLGLAVLQGIVRGHHGGVRVESEVGMGTTFYVYFPVRKGKNVVATGPEAGNGSDSAQRQRSGSGTVLITDDEEPVRTLAAEILKQDGFQTLEAPDGECGVELYKQHRDEIVVVLLDLTMPGMGGQATYQELRRLNPDLPIVLTSGYSNTEISRQFSATPPVSFIQKPFLPSELTRNIFKAIDNP
jgi:PAS domain S-box-containing protein